MAQDSNQKERCEEDTHEALATLLAPYRAFVMYVPLHDEVDIARHVALPSPAHIYTIQPDPSRDPREEARKVQEEVGDLMPVLFVPGQRFDAHGTRHGRGGGWYDRFLAAVPSSWLRIGCCTAAQFSRTPLTRAAWDEPVHLVAIENGNSLTLITREQV